MSYIKIQRNIGADISSSDIINYAEKLIPEFNIDQKTKEEKTKNAKIKLVYRFFKNNGYTWRKKIHSSHTISDDYIEVIINFCKILRIQRNYLNIDKNELSNIGNIDETPIYLDMNDYTWNTKGEKNIRIKSFGKEKIRISLMSTILADGTKLPLFFVVKDNIGKRKEKSL